MATIELFHGTSAKKAQEILKNGFNPGYLTSDENIAEYYAECVAEETDDDSEILIIEVNTDDLTADFPSYDEPLSFILKNNGYSSEDDWHDDIENNKIKYPEKNDWQSSLNTVFSVFCNCKIQASKIRIYE